MVTKRDGKEGKIISSKVHSYTYNNGITNPPCGGFVRELKGGLKK